MAVIRLLNTREKEACIIRKDTYLGKIHLNSGIGTVFEIMADDDTKAPVFGL